jgi:hypothetical protein
MASGALPAIPSPRRRIPAVSRVLGVALSLPSLQSRSPKGDREQEERAMEDRAMTEDLLMVIGVMLASAVCGWYVVRSIADIARVVPVDDLCTTAGQCLQLALG